MAGLSVAEWYRPVYAPGPSLSHERSRILGFGDQTAYDEHVAVLARDQQWHNQVWEPLLCHLKADPEVLKLAPTARSLMQGRRSFYVSNSRAVHRSPGI